MRVSSLNVNHGNDVMMGQFSFLSSSHKRDFPRTFTGNGLQKLSMFLVFKKKSAEIFHRLNTLINHRNDFKKVAVKPLACCSWFHVKHFHVISMDLKNCQRFVSKKIHFLHIFVFIRDEENKIQQ